MAIKIKHIKPEFVDERGFISRILDDKKVSIKSILYIERKKGAVGANHFHKKDSHYIYILKGKVRHYEKDMMDKEAKIESKILGPGDLVLTTAKIAHSQTFLEDTIFLALATEHRDQKDYEQDTVRIDFLADEKNT